MAKTRDNDLYLKLRFKRVLFLTGYYSPIEVELSYYHEDQSGAKKRTSLTDLDVLGIKYDAVLTPHKVVCDCKSGKNISDPNRLFWLRGVSDYFGAHACYFLRPKVGTHARAIAPKLGLRVLDERDLSELEHSLKVDTLVLPIADPDFHDTRQVLWDANIPSGAPLTSPELDRKRVVSYLSFEYWYIEPHRNLFQLLNHFNKIAHLLEAGNPSEVLLAYTGLERFAHCLLEMGGQIYARGLADVQRNARIYLYGGAMGLREREQFFRLLRDATGVQEELDPVYLPDVLELTNRMLHNSESASKVLPYLEAIYGWSVQLGNLDIEAVFRDRLDTGAIVLARDMCITFCRAAGLNENMFSALLAL